MQRQWVAPRPAAPAQQATPAAPVGAPAAAPKRNWLAPLAGLAAGLGIAALLSHFGMGEGMGNILMIALLAMAAVFVLKWLFGRKTTTSSDSAMQYAGAGGAGLPPPVAAPQFGSAAATAAVSPLAARVPEGFDSEGFLRIAKLNFVWLERKTTPKTWTTFVNSLPRKMFAEIKMQMDERGNAPQQTDVVTLNAELLEVTTKANRHVASVQLSGMIREVAGAAAAPSR